MKLYDIVITYIDGNKDYETNVLIDERNKEAAHKHEKSEIPIFLRQLTKEFK